MKYRCPFQAWIDYGTPLNTTSNEACKLFDASVTQVCLLFMLPENFRGAYSCQFKVSYFRTSFLPSVTLLLQVLIAPSICYQSLTYLAW